MQAPRPNNPGISVRDSVISGDVNVTHVHHQFPQTQQGVSREHVEAQLYQIQHGKNKKYNPELAAFISLVFPGSGHIQIGKSGLGWSVLILSLLFLFSSEIGFILYFGIGLGMAFHAYTLAHQLNGDVVHI